MSPYGIILGGLLWASAAFSASRIGGGILWDDGFFMSVPTSAVHVETLPNEVVRLRSLTLIGGNSGPPTVPLPVIVSLLRDEIPEMAAETNRNQFHQHFEQLEWTHEDHPLPCVELFSKNNDGYLTLIMGWGGKGVMLRGQAILYETLNEMIQSLQLNEGSCGWK